MPELEGTWQNQSKLHRDNSRPEEALLVMSLNVVHPLSPDP